MSEEISPEMFKQLAALAALDLDQEQADYLRHELNQQLKAIHELAAIPLDDDLRITPHGIVYDQAISPTPREDVWQPCADPQKILNQAPQVEDQYIIVPDIPHEKLD
jgi:aspartyl-tRNA(Asn)/glutamyl-tRNA(Gln) amidotransferase subunit C